MNVRKQHPTKKRLTIEGGVNPPSSNTEEEEAT